MWAQDTRSAIRWIPVFNTSGETIPPFAAMRIVDQRVVERQVVWNVAKPNATSELEQDRAAHIINGPEPIGASGDARYGAGTQDLPCQALYSGTSTLQTAGFKSGQWALEMGLAAYRSLGVDESLEEPTSSTQRIWITTGGFKACCYATLSGGETVEYPDYEASTGEQINLGAIDSTTKRGTFTLEDGRIKVGQGGIYRVTFAAEVEETSLTVQATHYIYKNNTSSVGPAATTFCSFETDEVSPIAVVQVGNWRMQVGFSALMKLAKDDYISVRVKAAGGSSGSAITTNLGHLVLEQI